MKSQELEDRELFDLILRMLDYEPSSRCTLAEAMTHSYFKWVLKALIALFVYFSKAILYPTFRRLPRDLKDKVDGFLTSKIVENGGGSTASSSSLQWVKCEYILHFLVVKFVFSVFIIDIGVYLYRIWFVHNFEINPNRWYIETYLDIVYYIFYDIFDLLCVIFANIIQTWMFVYWIGTVIHTIRVCKSKKITQF